ncbi:tRNA (guanosine(18)-2'-O)-methyltransferase [[Candida] jaroonii]|uniref:tRNA (Guanosine(18)-2'-O)-methyltransferase n=1 Tax=[Candida] jaroonii TaxID=467808 RepID=A0ACA9YDG8_9ASCO|nr:tRNA (guanosine(18)-2'-O)-methyltransferase [[Candida] jaroonii]
MSSTLSLVSRLLDGDKLNKIVIELSKDFQHDGNLDNLCELIDQVDVNTVEIVSKNAVLFTNEVIETVHDEEYFDKIVKLAGKLPHIYESLVDTVVAILRKFMKQNINKFIIPIRSKVERTGLLDIEGQAYEIEYIEYLLRFLERVFSKINLSLSNSSIDDVLSYLMTLDIEEVYTLTLKVFRWRIVPVTAKTLNTRSFWDIIFSLVSTGNRSHQVNAYILWLRYLNNDNSKFENDQLFQNEILNNDYFEIIQNGLISDLHEHRKLCLSVLKLSILKINTDLNNEIFVWSTSKKDQYLQEWERFITVFEIIAIDTSLHQMEAASGDLIGLISPKSLIHSSWGFRLLSTGFRAGTDAVRKFSLFLLLNIPPTSLCLIQNALPILEDIFLPNLMLANHLVVNNDKCEYGEKLVSFISQLIKGASNVENSRKIVHSVFKVMIECKGAFDPCKFYILLGVYSGIEGQILEYGYHDDLLVSLFECKSEGLLYHAAIQTILLRTSLKFKFQNSNFLKVMDKFIKFNGSKLINDNLDIIKNYLVESDASFEPVEDKAINAIGVYLQWIIKGFQPFEDQALFTYLLGSGLDLSLVESQYSSWFKTELTQLVDSGLDNETYEILSTCNTIKENVDISNIWKEIKSGVLLETELELRISVFKYSFFNKIFENLSKEEISKIMNVEEFLAFRKDIFVNYKTNVSPTFYKVKESVLGEYYKTLEVLTKSGLISDYKPFIDQIPANLSNHQSNMSIASFSSMIINSDVSDDILVDISEILLEIWHSLESTRFKLHQKEIQVAIIRCVMHQKVLTVACGNEDLAEKLVKFSVSLIDNAQGRRCLLPVMAKQISIFQIESNASFEKSAWLTEVLTRAFNMYQLRSNSFKLEPLIGGLFDEHFGDVKDPLYLKVYEVHEISAQVHLMAIFNSIKTTTFANSLLQYIVDNQKMFKLFKCHRPNDGYEQWTRIRLFTIIICISDKVGDEMMREHLPTFLKLLDVDPSPLVRVFIEWIVALQMVKFPEYFDSIFKSLRQLLNNKISKPALICAYERMLTLSIEQLPTNESGNLLAELLYIAIPGATANKALIRHFSSSLICCLYPKLPSDISKDLREICRDIYETSLLNPVHEVRNNDALLWDIYKDLTLVSVSGGLLMRVSAHEVDLITSNDFHDYLDESQIQFLNHPVGEDLKHLWIKTRNVSAKKEALSSSVNPDFEQSPLQTKSGAWSTVLDVEESSSRINDVKRSDLIVVSSLVDKPPNLGGICRLCDVLGAGLLTVNDIEVKKHQEFKTVAVTADHWMPMIEVKVPDIVSYLRQKKNEGYTLIGLEQTDKSVQLNSDLKFPKKSLILIGKEREGVPGELLAELDFCVEIKQVGIIRSMNIQTATAVIVHAYASQHC